MKSLIKHSGIILLLAAYLFATNGILVFSYSCDTSNNAHYSMLPETDACDVLSEDVCCDPRLAEDIVVAEDQCCHNEVQFFCLSLSFDLPVNHPNQKLTAPLFTFTQVSDEGNNNERLHQILVYHSPPLIASGRQLIIGLGQQRIAPAPLAY